MTLPVIDAAASGRQLDLDAEVVVVGSGAAGAVVATELAEAGRDVVVLEEGRHLPNLGQMRRSEVLRHAWRDGGTTIALGLGDTPGINIMTGRGVGGSSLLTGGVCFRTPNRVLDTWVREHGLTSLTPAAMEPYFEAVERHLHVEEVPVEMRSRSTVAFDRGATALGYPLHPLRRNTIGCRGYSRCNFVCPHGAKQSVDVSYLPRAVAAGARIYSNCLVERVDLSGDRAVGVSGTIARRGHRLTVRARRVVLACGALHTPVLLLASGIGRGNKQIGRNLTLHPGFRVFGRFDERIDGWRGALQAAFSDAFESEGITLVGLAVPPPFLTAMVGGVGPVLRERCAAIPHIAMFGAMLHDDPSGRVRRGFRREPMVFYRMSRRDRARIPRLIRIMIDTYLAAGAREVYLPILGHDPVRAETVHRVDLDNLRGRHFEAASQHPLGSCRMGVDPKTSVVDDEGRVWGVRDLYVADGSIVPTSLGVNPQVSIMAMATRLAWRWREQPA